MLMDTKAHGRRDPTRGVVGGGSDSHVACSEDIGAAAARLDREIDAAVSDAFRRCDRGVPRRALKVIFFGNSGRGKSLLCNALVGAGRFQHATAAGSVTAAAEFAVVPVEASGVWVVLNVPGLIESNEDHLARNQAAIEVAFRVLPDVPTAVLLVSRPSGGRMEDEDRVAFGTLFGFVPDVPPGSVALVNNGVDSDDFADDAEERRFKDDWVAAVQSAFASRVPAANCVFAPKLARAAREAPGTHPDMLELQATLRRLIAESLAQFAVPLTPPADRRLVLDAVAIKEETARVKEEGARGVAARAAEVDAARQAHAAQLEVQRQRQAAERAAVERRIAALQQQHTDAAGDDSNDHHRRHDAGTEPSGSVEHSAAAAGGAASAHDDTARPRRDPTVRESPPPHKQRVEPQPQQAWRIASALHSAPVDFGPAEEVAVTHLRATPHGKLRKVLVLGNSGTGKSFLGNAIVGYEAFAHGSGAGAVTQLSTARAVVDPEDGDVLMVYDLRALAHLNATAATLNGLSVKAAIGHMGDHPQLANTSLVFMFGNDHGRLSGQDLGSANAVLDFLRDVEPSCVSACGVVVNFVEPDEFASGPEYLAFLAETKKVIQGTLQCPSVGVTTMRKYDRRHRCPEIDFGVGGKNAVGSTAAAEALLLLRELLYTDGGQRLALQQDLVQRRPLVLHSRHLEMVIERARQSMVASTDAHRRQLATMEDDARAAYHSEQLRQQQEVARLTAQLQQAAQPSRTVYVVKKPQPGLLESAFNYFFGP